MADTDPDDEKWLKYFGAKSEPEGDPSDSAWLNYFGAGGSKPKVAQDTTPERLDKQQAQQFAGAVQGVVGLPGVVEEIGNQFGPRWMNHNRLFPTPEEIGKATGLGMEQHPELAPQNAFERYAGAATRALPNAAAIAATGGGALPALMSAGGGELLGQAAHDIAPDQAWLQIGAGIVGGIAGAGGASKIAKTLATRALTRDYTAAQRKLDWALIEAERLKNPANRLVAPTGAVATAKNELTAAQDAAFEGRESARLAAERIAKASEGKRAATEKYVDDTLTEARKASEAEAAQAEKDLGKHFEATAGEFGKSKTPQQAGEALQEHSLAWAEKELPKQIQNARKPVQEAMVGTATPVPNFAGTLNALASEGGDLKGVISHFAPNLPDRVKASLEDVLAAGKATESKPIFSKTLTNADGSPVQIGQTAAKPAKPLDWDDVSDLRTAVGAAAKHAKITKDPAEQQLQALYAGLTGDLRAAAKTKGDDVLSAFDNFNEVSTKLNTFKDNVLGKIVSATNENKEKLLPGKVAEQLLATAASDGTELAALRQHLPKAADELAAYVLRQGPEALAKLSPEARVALFGEKEQGLTAVQQATAAAKEAAETRLAQAQEVARQTKLRAKLDHDALVDAAQEGARTGNHSRLKEVREAQKAREAAAEERTRLAETLSQEQRQARYDAAQKVKAAKKAVKQLEAKAAGTEPKSLTEQIRDLGTDIKSKLYSGAIGGTLGYHFAPELISAIGGQPGTMSNALLSVAGGLAGPAAVNAGRAFLSNPATIRYPIGGAVAGSNALTSPAK